MITFEYYILGFFFVFIALFISVFDLSFIMNFLNGSRADQYELKRFAEWKFFKSIFYGILILVQFTNECVFFPLPQKNTYFLRKADNIELYSLILCFESLFVILLLVVSISLLKKARIKIDRGEVRHLIIPIDRKRVNAEKIMKSK